MLDDLRRMGEAGFGTWGSWSGWLAWGSWLECCRLLAGLDTWRLLGWGEVGWVRAWLNESGGGGLDRDGTWL